MINTLCHMMFIRQKESDPIDDVEEVKNKEAYTMFVKAFNDSVSTEVQSYLLETMLSLLKLNKSGYNIIVTHIAPFEVLFSRFDELELKNKEYILMMVEEIITLENTVLSKPELTYYCQLLQNKSPLTVIMVIQQITRLIKEEKITGKQCKAAQLVVSLLEFTNMPLHCKYNMNDLSYVNQLSFCLQKIDAIQENQGYNFPMISEYDLNKLQSFNGLDPFQHIITNHKITTSDFLKIFYSISSMALELMGVFLQCGRKIQYEFYKKGGFKKLRDIVTHDALRHPILRVIAIIAIGDSHKIHVDIVKQLISVLQNYGKSSTIKERKLITRMDILSTLACIFQSNEHAKNAFREGSGFEWAISVLGALGDIFDKSNQHQKLQSQQNGSPSVSHQEPSGEPSETEEDVNKNKEARENVQTDQADPGSSSPAAGAGNDTESQGKGPVENEQVATVRNEAEGEENKVVEGGENIGHGMKEKVNETIGNTTPGGLSNEKLNVQPTGYLLSFLKAILNTFTIVLHNNLENCKYFKAVCPFLFFLPFYYFHFLHLLLPSLFHPFEIGRAHV